MKSKKYDFLVVGGGTGGLRIAMTTVHNGLSTCVINPGVLGGTCLNNGCIPTKTMLEAGHFLRHSQKGHVYGVKSSAKADFLKIMRRVRSIINEGQRDINTSVKKYKNLNIINGTAKFVGKKIVSVNGKTYTAKNIIIATGSKNFVPPIDGLSDVGYLDNQSVLNLKKIPKSIVMVGGGYISMEFATFFNSLGSKVTVLQRAPTILPRIDREARELLQKIYSNRGITFKTGVEIVHVEKDHGKDIVKMKDSSGKIHQVSATEIFIATGRMANTSDLGLKEAGIKTTKRGEIKVDATMKTNTNGVYAIGDCNGRGMFAHAAKREERIVIDNLFRGKKSKLDDKMIPWAVFTDPPVAGIGYTNEEIPSKSNIGVLKAPFRRSGRARIMDEDEGFAKVFYDKKNDRITGALVIGVRADDIIHEFVALMVKKATIHDLREIVHIHPTVSEVMEALH